MVTAETLTAPRLTRVHPYASTRMPDCRGLKAFVLPGAFYGSCVALMAEAGFTRANVVEEADVVVFTGGADINPELYGQQALSCTSFSKDRDTIEEFYFHKAVKNEVPMFGICRGAQFLHAMNGGKLWQDVNNHAGSDHMVLDIEDNVAFRVTSIHHQMLQLNDKIQVIAIAKDQVATRFEDDTLIIDMNKQGSNTSRELEIEAGCYTETRCFFVQGHPEIGDREYRAWTMNKLYDFIIDWMPFKGDDSTEDMKKVIQDAATRGGRTIN